MFQQRKMMASVRRAVLVVSLLLSGGAMAVGCASTPVEVAEPVKEPVKLDPIMSKTAEEWFLAGVGFLQQTPADRDAARQHFENAIKREAGYLPAHINLAVLAEQERRYEDAVAAYGAALEVDSADAKLHIGLGRAYLGLGSLNEAVESFKAALVRDAGSLEARNDLAVALLKKGDLDAAERMAKDVLAVEAENVVALNTLGLVFNARKRPAVARYIFEKARAAEPTNPQVLNNLGLIAFDEQQVAAAVELFLQAIESDPEFVPARLNVGAIYLDYLDYAAAAEQFEVAYRLWPQNPAAHLGYAASLYGAGEYEKSAQLYEEYAQLYPDHEQPAVRLSRLYERQLQDPAKSCVWYSALVEKFRKGDPALTVQRDFVCKEAGK